MPAINIPNLNVNEIGEGLKDSKNYEMILDTLQRYRKELNFYLMNLDLDNMPSVGGLIGDLQGDYSLISQTVDGILLSVGNIEGDVSALQITAGEILASVADNTGNISTLTQTAQGIQTTVSNQGGQISTLTQTVNGISSQVASLDTEVGGFYSEISQLSNEISSIVSFTDVTGNQIATKINQTATTITLDASKINLNGITHVNKQLRVGSTSDGSVAIVFGGSGANITSSPYGVAGLNINASDTYVYGNLWVGGEKVTPGGTATMKWA